MLRYLLVALLILSEATISSGQESAHYLFDMDSKKPIGDAFLFVDQGDINAITNDNGEFHLPTYISPHEMIFFSHVNYGLHQLSFSNLINLDTVFLEATSHDLPQLQIAAAASKKRGRWLKKFYRSFLGEDYKKFNTTILNEEAILFSESKGQLQAASTDLLEIENQKLGYKIYYWLEDFNRSAEGKVNYHGKYSFEHIPSDSTDVAIARQSVYTNSVLHFFKSILNGTHRHFYEIRAAKLNDQGALMNLGKVNIKKFLSFDEKTSLYSLQIPDFLEIEHLNLDATSFNTDMRGITGIGNRSDQDLVKDGLNKKSSAATHKTSLLFSNTSQLIFDKQGTIQNTQYIQYYGYWASKGMANVLPSTYRVKNIEPSDKINKVNQNELLIRMLTGVGEEKYSEIFSDLSSNWSTALVAPLAEIMMVTNNYKLLFEINQFLSLQTKANPGGHALDWLQWSWKQNTTLPDWYTNFKSDLYRPIDKQFHRYFFDRQSSSTIRLSEVVWGGVKQDGIPPLRHPKLLDAKNADYLADDDIVFGIVHNNIARAYPKRILGWHEMVVDQFGQDTLTGVYCTLCGTMIAYNNRSAFGHHNLGTSGFLYRSNKLMYDQETQSLWSTIEGKPVVGPLVNNNIELEMIPVVTTTWKDWKSQHPNSIVLSLATGFNRNYAEGEAYKKYFSHDDLMFPVPISDSRLKNKDVVFVLRAFDEQRPIAFDKKYLIKKRLLHHQIGQDNIVLIANKAGKVVAFNSDKYMFNLTQDGDLLDQFKDTWDIHDDRLQHASAKISLMRLPGHEIFWFAWVNAFPNTVLLK